MFTRAHHCPHPPSLFLEDPGCHVPSDFSHQNSACSSLPSVYATCLNHLILLHHITLIQVIFGGKYKSRKLSCNFLQSPDTFSLLDPNIFFRTQFSNTFSPVAYRRGGGGGGVQPPPEIPKIPVETSIAQARRTGVSISFCSSLCSHTVVIY